MHVVLIRFHVRSHFISSLKQTRLFVADLKPLYYFVVGNNALFYRYLNQMSLNLIKRISEVLGSLIRRKIAKS